MIKKILLGGLLVLLLTHVSFAQQRQIDSLRLQLSGKSNKLEIDLLNKIAFGNLYINPIAAKDDVEIAYELSKELSYDLGRAKSLLVMGGMHWSMGEYQEALSHYMQGLDIYKKLDDKSGIASSYNNIGEVYKRIKRYDLSKEFLLKSIQLRSRLPDSSQIALSYYNIGELHIMTHTLDSAEQYFKIAYELAMKSDNKIHIAYALEGIGTLAMERGDYKAARAYLNDALNIRKEGNDIRGMAATSLNLTKLYIKTDQLDSAESYLNHALDYARRTKADQIRQNIYMIQSKIDSLQENYYEAYSHYMQYAELKDSLENKEKLEQINRVHAYYERDVLKAENEAAKLQLNQRNTVIITISMVLVFIGALAFALYKQKQVQDRANRDLQAKNEEIALKNEEIASQSERLMELNNNLEDKIKDRTEMLLKQNAILEDYVFINAHELRAPVANILGLINLLTQTPLKEKEQEIVGHLKKSSNELDAVIQNIRTRLESDDAIKNI